MLQLKNNTPFGSNLTLLYDKNGVDTLYVMVSATFNVSRKWTLADEQIPPHESDEYWTDDPETSSIKYASEYHIGKQATDIVMLGHARAPEGKKVLQQDVSLSVGQLSKTVRVFGDRCWQDGQISRPEWFEAMPLVYEKAFGGIHRQDGDIISAEYRNLVGCGYLGKQKASVLDGQLLPNLEDPRNLLTKAGDIVPPAGFGFISPGWQPRVNYAGTYDDEWKSRRAPFLPEDFDPHYLSMAHPDLIYPGYIAGGEPVVISGVHPLGKLQFTIPVIGLNGKVNMNNNSRALSFNMETVVIEPDDMKLTLNWRAALTCDKDILKIKEVTIGLAQPKRQAA